MTPRNEGFWRLPDASGFLLFEKKVERSDNLLLLDAQGKERMRLDVPWRMTGATKPECGQYPTCFVRPTGPYPNPATGEEGKFGVMACVQSFYDQAAYYALGHCSETFYFELDYHTGQFLWCYLLERG